MSDSVRPHRRQPTRLPRPWDFPGRSTAVGCHFLLQYMKGKLKVKSLSRVQLFETPWTAAYQAPLSMGFSRREYWSGVPLPSPPMQGICVQFLAQEDSTWLGATKSMWHNYWPHVPWRLCCVWSRAWSSPCSEKPKHRKQKSRPCSQQSEKACTQ